MSIVVAIDGTAASGKGTIAKKLAKNFGFAHLDSGKLYRCVALEVLDARGDPAQESDALNAVARFRQNAGGFGNPAFLNDKRLLRADVGEAASLVSAFGRVRAELLQFQRDFAAHPPGGPPGAVIDGRDIGTVVCPHAQAKLFVDAAPEIRAHRRWLELKALGDARSEAEILNELNERDARDRARAIAPMKPAPDAALLDTSALDIDAAFKAALAIVERSLKVQPKG